MITIGYSVPEGISYAEVKLIIKEYMNIYNSLDNKNTWFLKVKDLCEKLGYAKDMKSYKKDKSAYRGNIADVTTVIRIILANKSRTQDLYEVMRVMGEKRVIQRLQHALLK